jgi:hypothetical protein
VGHNVVDILASLLCLVTLVLGLYLGWTISPQWLNRFGSILVIIGVWIAFIRLEQWFEPILIEVLGKHDLFINSAAGSVFNRESDNNLTLSDGDRDRVLLLFKNELYKEFTSVIMGHYKQRQKFYEIYLVIGGTFLNGFGDLIIDLVRNFVTRYGAVIWCRVR